MIISRESDYALRILRALADGEKRTVASICESELIPEQFAHKIVAKLQKADFVECTRGRHGGCMLKADLHEVSLYDLLHVVDNECYVNLCMKPGYDCPWEASHPEGCKVHRRLAGLQKNLDDTFQGMDLHTVIFE